MKRMPLMVCCLWAWVGVAAENVALHKPYTLSPAPSYRLCTDAGDAVQLTDGEYVKGYFWTQKGTVGWTHAAPALVTVDLGRVEPIRGASWSCAAGKAGVTWPECLYVLVSDDRKSWTCLGDLCELGTVEQLPPEKDYGLFRFATDRLRGHGRYVCIVAAAEPYCFVDEVEVWRGEDAWLQDQTEEARIDDVKAFYARSCSRSGLACRLRADARTVREQARALGGPVGAEVERALRDAESGVAACVVRAGPVTKTVLPLPDSPHERILSLHARVLRAAGVCAPLVWHGDRWSPLSLLELPPQGAAAERIGLDLMRGEVRGETFNVTNPNDEALSLTFSVAGLPPDANVELREVLVTDTKGREAIAAALRPLPAEGPRVGPMRVPGGCTRQVWVSCRRPRCAAGRYAGEIGIASADGRFAGRLALDLHVRDLDFPARPALHVGGWDYVQGQADYYKAPGNLAANLALMRDLYVDSPWATSSVFPQGASFDAQGALTNGASLDFSAWDAWVERWAGARNYCVFFGVGSSFHGERMGTPRFGAMLGAWLGAWTRHMAAQGLRPEQLVVLLVDEPHERAQDAVIVAWARAVKAARLGVTLFEDPTYENPAQGDPAMYALSDVLCPNTPMMVARGEPFRAFYRARREAGKTLWLYSCSGPAKQLDPIAYHRVQAWLAFQMGAEGSFYWALGCGGGIGDSWRAYEQLHAEYSPYFVAPDGVMEGKHSEALREGVQDYEYLRMLREAAGRARAAGGDAAWLTRAQAVLSEGVAQAVAVASPSNQFWRVPKDRTVMDVVRVRALDVLEEAKERGR